MKGSLWQRLLVLLGGRRVKTPSVLQMQPAECGAACLAMILGYHGRHESLERLHYLCGVARDGARASNVIKAARRIGLLAKGFAVNLHKIRRMPRPFVALWNFSHFVVVEDIGRGRVWINDPASGPRRVSWSQFCDMYSGVLLAFEPGAAFETNEQPPAPLMSFVRRMRGSWEGIAFMILVSVAFFVPGLVMPAFSRLYVDFFLIENQERWLWPLIAVMGVTALVAGVLSWLLNDGAVRFYTKLLTTWSSQMMWRVLRLPLAYFARRQSGDLNERIQYNDTLAWLVAGELASTFLSLTTILIYALVMVQYDINLTLVGIVFAAVNLVAFLQVSRRLKHVNRQLYRDRGKAAGVLMRGLQSIDTYQATGTEALFYDQWASQHTKVANAVQSIGRTRAILSALPPFLALISTTVILVVGGVRIMDSTLTIGMLVAFQGLMAAFSLPLQKLTDSSVYLLETQGILSRLDDVQRQPYDEEFERGGASPQQTFAPSILKGMPHRLGGALELRDVSYGFSPLDPPFIEGFCLRLEPGRRIALVGASGSGKSTVGRMIAGVFRPWTGEVLIDGRRLEDIPRDVFRNTVAVVDQEIALFEGTVAENITMWDKTLGESRVIRAAKDACLHDDVARRPDGYRERIEEGGRNFSGGERQRLEIARALVNEPSILILDEATSALDAKTEERIIENLRHRGCTMVLIAHRLSTIRDCDEILVLEAGRVVERGTHQELMTAGGLYRALLQG